MPKVHFTPEEKTCEANAGTKILLVAMKNAVDIRFGCASCRCGTCAVKISNPQSAEPMKEDEKALLTKMELETTGEIRLACRAKVTGDLTVDIAFQDTYEPAESAE